MTSTFFSANNTKNIKNMLNYDVHTKQHFLMPTNLKKPKSHGYGIKMITWESNFACGRGTLVEPTGDVPTLLKVDLVFSSGNRRIWCWVFDVDLQ